MEDIRKIHLTIEWLVDRNDGSEIDEKLQLDLMDGFIEVVERYDCSVTGKMTLLTDQELIDSL